MLGNTRAPVWMGLVLGGALTWVAALPSLGISSLGISANRPVSRPPDRPAVPYLALPADAVVPAVPGPAISVPTQVTPYPAIAPSPPIAPVAPPPAPSWPEPTPPPPPTPAPPPSAPLSPMERLKQSGKRWIEIDTSRQRLFAWEGNKQVYAVIVSTGKASTPTPSGVFAIQSRHRYARMRGADYDVPDVPYTMYYSGNYAIHGAYWHNRFGTPVSHGCVNVAVDHAKWLFEWASIGTPVVVHR